MQPFSLLKDFLRENNIDYLRIQKIIHWLMAIIIMLDLNIAQKFGGEMELLDRLESRVDHATAGMIVTFLFILRILLRYRYVRRVSRRKCLDGKHIWQN